MRRRVGKWPDVRLWRQNTGAALMGDQMVSFGRAGAFDVTGVVRGGRRVEIELKVGSRTLTDEQIATLRLHMELGTLCGVCRSVGHVLDLFASVGLHEEDQVARAGQFWQRTTLQDAANCSRIKTS